MKKIGFIIISLGIIAIVILLINLLIFSIYASLLGIVGFLWFLYDRFVMKPDLTNEELRTQTLNFVNELFRFCQSRHQNEPQVDFDNWEQSTNAMTNYGNETRQLYLGDFASRASYLYKEFKKKGLEDKNIAHSVENAVNRLVMESIAVKLGTLARQL